MESEAKLPTTRRSTQLPGREIVIEAKNVRIPYTLAHVVSGPCRLAFAGAA
jgi:hypothetical protein